MIKNVRNILRLKKEKDDIAVKDIRNLLVWKKKRKQLKKEYLEILGTFFWHKEDYNKPVRVSNFSSIGNLIFSMKVTVIEIKHSRLKKIRIKLDHI